MFVNRKPNININIIRPPVLGFGGIKRKILVGVSHTDAMATDDVGATQIDI
jgi:hypothetical protein